MLVFPSGLFLCSLDYALRFPRSGWQQESVLPVFGSSVELSCFLKWALTLSWLCSGGCGVISMELSEFQRALSSLFPLAGVDLC